MEGLDSKTFAEIANAEYKRNTSPQDMNRIPVRQNDDPELPRVFPNATSYRYHQFDFQIEIFEL